MNNIRIAREEKGLTGEQLGKRVGVKKSAISKYEREAIQPSKDILLALSRELGYSIDFLYCNPTLGKDRQLDADKNHPVAENDEVTSEIVSLITKLNVVNRITARNYLAFLLNGQENPAVGIDSQD